jgi:nucleoside-diphosphate-sugar epimerase
MNKRQVILIIGWDGYIGFPLTMKLLSEGHIVYGIDNYIRRAAVKEMHSISASTISDPYDRRELLYKIGNFTHKDLDVIYDYDKLYKLVQRVKPTTIVNLGHNPSAPYSQIDKDHADYVLKNNVLGTNNLLWIIKECVPDCHYITIGSTGEYQHDINVDIEEGYFKFQHNDRLSKESLFPRRGNSIYHCSKIASTYMIDYLSRIWNLRCTDVMQSVVFGLYTPECDKWKEYTRIDTDDAFGTVIHRFVIQSMLGVPMTVFGDGKHQRAFLSLNDSIQALMLAVNNPANQGRVQTWNQLSEWHSIMDVAKMVQKVVSSASIKHIESPRKEYTGEHYYNYRTDNLKNLGYSPTRDIFDEISYMIKNIDLVDKRDILLDVVKPKVIF